MTDQKSQIANHTSDGQPLSILQVLEKGLFSTGSVVQMFQLAQGLTRRGHRVAIVSRPEGDVPQRAREEAIDFAPLPLRHEFDFPSARSLARLYDSRKVDVVHVHKGIAHSVALFATLFTRRRPVLVVNRGVSFPLDVLNRIKYHVRMEAVVTVCEDIKKVIVASGKIPAEKVHVIYAGVDLSRFDPARADGGRVRSELGIAPDRFLLLQVGAREWKGWKDLIAASARLAGDFPKLTTVLVACENQSKKDEVLSYARGLGITGTLREAMALERPVIASGAGGNPELVIGDESGLLVPPRDVAACAAAVRRLMEEPSLASRLARGGRARVEKGFSSEVRLDRIEGLYRRLIAERAREGESARPRGAGR
ncbi:MAG TPA: glycosyltransferase family 4 protein [Thermoanaerobaculia bacterium]|nr:glycosyltransferase family 4 protein [Thermoanaerobaculia bacterium]